MKALPMIILSTALTGCSLFTAGPSVPPPLEGKWKVTDDNDCELGFRAGTEIETRDKTFGRRQFELRIKPQPCVGKHSSRPDPRTLGDPTLFFAKMHGHSAIDADHCAENRLSQEDEKHLLRARPGLPFLQVFNDLASGRLHTFLSGVGYLRDVNSTEDEPHLLISFSYVVGDTCDAKNRKYVLSVTSFGNQPGPRFHNGVVHGKP